MSQGFGKNDRITWFRRDPLNTFIDSCAQVTPFSGNCTLALWEPGIHAKPPLLGLVSKSSKLTVVKPLYITRYHIDIIRQCRSIRRATVRPQNLFVRGVNIDVVESERWQGTSYFSLRAFKRFGLPIAL